NVLDLVCGTVIGKFEIDNRDVSLKHRSIRSVARSETSMASFLRHYAAQHQNQVFREWAWLSGRDRMAVDAYSDNRRSLFALGSNSALWRQHHVIRRYGSCAVYGIFVFGAIYDACCCKGQAPVAISGS